jgi:peptidoglycan/LPS O-acetylase OafA/YrhL
MDPVSLYPATAALFLALTCAYCIARRTGGPPEQGRFASLDGLRGYLAFFVFLHHSAIWYFYLRTGQWKVPPSNLYTHFGQSSVAMFFMITGFLFWSKLIDGREKPIDWTRLFISRVLRLAPLYFFVLMLLVIVIAWLSNFTLIDPPTVLLKGLVRWASFTVLGNPDLNGVQGTPRILAYAIWSLPYEWLFYLSLPLFALPFRMPSPRLYVVLGAMVIVGAILSGKPKPEIISSFAGGIVAAFLARSRFLRSIAVLKASALVAVACVVIGVSCCHSAHNFKALVLLSVAFAIIACGNSLFGLLTHAMSRTLGEISYSIYLLHGIVLFVAFNFIIDPIHAASLSALQHWSVIFICSPVLVFLGFTAFRLIEAPAMRRTPYVTAWIHLRLKGGGRSKMQKRAIVRRSPGMKEDAKV